MKKIDLNVVLRRIPPKWRLPVLTGVGILWLGLLAGLGWLFLADHKPERIIFDEAELEKAPHRQFAAVQRAFRAVSLGVPVQAVRSDGEKSEVFAVGPAEYLDMLRTFPLAPPTLLTNIRQDAPDYLIPADRYNPYAAYTAYARSARGMTANTLFEAGGLSGHIWLDKEFLEDAEPEANAEDGSLLICGDSRKGQVCLAFLDAQHERRAKGESAIRPDYRFIAAADSKSGARKEIALYRRLVAEQPQVLAALSREGLQAVKVEKMELRRNKEKSAPACLVEVTVANTDPGQRDVEGVDLHCYILDDHGKPVQYILMSGNDRQRISAGRRPRTYTFELNNFDDASRSRQIKLLEGSYRLQIIPCACRLDGKQTRALPTAGSNLPEGVSFRNGVWMYEDAPLSLKDVPQLLTVDQKYAGADAERLKAEMEARRPTLLRLATWLHNKTLRSLALSAPKITFDGKRKGILELTLTNMSDYKLFEVTIAFAFVNAEGYPCRVMRFRSHANYPKPGEKREQALSFSDALSYFLLQEVQRGNMQLSIFAAKADFFDRPGSSVLERKDGKLQADVFAFYQRDGVWYHNGTALPAEAADCTEKPLFEPDVSPEDEEDLKARLARYEAWFNTQRDRLTPLAASRFAPRLSNRLWYRSQDDVRQSLWVDAAGDKDVWMLDKNRIPDDIVREAGLEPWPRNEARKAEAEAAAPTATASPAPTATASPAPTAPASPAPAAADEDLTPEAAPAGEGGTPAPAAPAPEVAIAPSTPEGAPRAAAPAPSRETITATAGLAASSAAHKTVFAIRFGNAAAAPARVSYRTFFLEGGKMFGRRESKLVITVPANGEQIVHLGSNKPELADIAARMRAGTVQMLVEIVDVEPAP